MQAAEMRYTHSCCEPPAPPSPFSGGPIGSSERTHARRSGSPGNARNGRHMNDERERLRKLIALAEGEGASRGEIDNALRMAARLMDKHHLSRADIDDLNARESEAADTMPTMGEARGVGTSLKLASWEAILYNAVCALIGTVSAHKAGPEVIRHNGVARTDGRGNARRGMALNFYGPLDDAREAAELYQQWAHLIAAMGVRRWGGCYRGDGAQYCLGFASALRAGAQAAAAARRTLPAKPLLLLTNGSTSGRAPAPATALTVQSRHDLIKEAADDWFAKEHGWKPSGGSSRSCGYSGAREAYKEGFAHGQRAGFSRGGTSRGQKRLT